MLGNIFAKKKKNMLYQDLVNLGQEFGTPLYVYDAEKISSQYHRLTKAFSKVENFKIHYAVKALSNVSILKFLKNLGSGLDTVSIQEVQLGLHAGFQPKDIIYTPNGVSMQELETVAALGVQINIDNLSILLFINALSPAKWVKILFFSTFKKPVKKISQFQYLIYC